MNKATPEQLRAAVTEMDAVAQGAFSEIASMASLALLALEQPSTYASNGLRLEDVAAMLAAIQDKARDMDDYINTVAEGVGYNYVDAGQRRRSDARRKARESAEGRV